VIAGTISSTLAFDAIGSHWEIETDEPLDADVQRLVRARIEDYDATYSRFRADSLVSRIAASREGGRFEFPEDSVPLFDLYDRLFAATHGAVDPLIGQALELLGYDASYSLTPAPAAVRTHHHAQGRATWSTDVSRDSTTLATRRPVLLDVGAAGKGQLVDIVSAILKQSGVPCFVVDASGDLRHEVLAASGLGSNTPTTVAS
jgi:thiamine biosynthesis lipoprotein